jgi:DNA invertase Pin-like site-specific DNA recombinase
MQIKSLRQYAKQRGWQIVHEAQEVGSGAKARTGREELLNLARRREIDQIVVWRLDRWGRSVQDLIGTLTELNNLGVGFVSLTEALDFNSATGRAMAGLLAVFAEFERELIRERVKAGIADARRLGKPHGRPQTVTQHTKQVKALFKQGLSQTDIARKIGIGRSSVGRLLKT